MAIFDRLIPRARTSSTLQESERIVDSMRAQLNGAALENESLQESMRELSLYLEDFNWIPIDGWSEEDGFSLDVVKETAEKLRPLLAVNPTIKKAMNARVGYIWSRGVSFKGVPDSDKVQKDAHNKRLLFKPSAYWKMEAKLATDGNAWFVKGVDAPTVTAVPIEQIAGWVVDENDPTRVLYWLRRYSVKTQNFATGQTVDKYVEVFIPAVDNENPKSTSIENIKVDRSQRMHHIAANRQETWILGIPDLLAAMFWAKGFKELYEAGATYVKAQGKFASKVVSKTAQGAGKAAATIANAPRRDPDTGEILDNGGTAIMSGGLDYQLMGKMSGGVDFGAFDPVGGLIAVGLGIPLSVILGTSDGEEKTLEQSVVNEMRLRQELWSSFYEGLWAPRDVTVVWPKIKTEPTYRQIQSIELSNKSVTLSREEMRQLTLEAYGIEGNPAEIPDIEENAYYMVQKLLADNAAKNQQDLASQQAEDATKLAATTPEQGVDAGVGKLSTGADSKDSRNNKSDTNTKNQ